MVWLQDVKCHVVVALSSEDDIVPSPAIRAYVARHYGLPDSTSTITALDSQQQAQALPDERARGGSASLAGGLSWGRRRGRWAGSALAVLRNPRRRIGAWRTLFHRPSQAAAREQEGLPDARLIYWDGLGHGAMLFSLEAQDRLIDAVHAQARDRGIARWDWSEYKPSDVVVMATAAAAAQQQQEQDGVVPEPAPPAPSDSASTSSSGGDNGSSRIKQRFSSPKWRLPTSPFWRARQQLVTGA